MHFSGGIPIDYLVSPLVAIGTNDRHWYQWTGGIPPYSYLIHSENILSPLNDMHFTNGIPIERLVIGTNRTIGTNGRPESPRTRT